MVDCAWGWRPTGMNVHILPEGCEPVMQSVTEKCLSRGDKPDTILSESEGSCGPLYLREAMDHQTSDGVALAGVTLGSKEPLG